MEYLNKNEMQKISIFQFIISKSRSEITMCPQMFIVKILIIGNMASHHIYMKHKEGVSELTAANRGSISCINGRWRNGPFGIS
jgi:hypothetical protein